DRRALAISKIAKQDPKQIALLLGAQVAVELGHAAEAERSLKEDVTRHETALPKDPTPQLAHAYTLLQLVWLYQQSECDAEAGLLAERVLGIIEQVLGPDHVITSPAAVEDKRHQSATNNKRKKNLKRQRNPAKQSSVDAQFSMG